MPDLNFQITGVEVPAHAATPQLVFKLDASTARPEERIHSMVLKTQVRFEAPGRSYNEQEREKLRDLFGAPEQWGRSLRSLRWTHVDVTVPSFTGQKTVDLPVECSYDLHVAGTKYFYALDEGEVPLLFLFSGTIFYEGDSGELQVQRIARTKEDSYRLPVAKWEEMIDYHFPNTSWLYLRTDVFEKLYAYKRREGLPTWEQVIEHLLPERDDKSESVNEHDLEETEEVAS